MPIDVTFDRTRQRGLPVWLPILAGLLIVARIVSSQIPVHAASDLVEWTVMRQAVPRARLTHRPILYEFSAAWCGPCKRLKEEVFTDPTMARMINDRYVPVAVVDRKAEDGQNPPQVQELMDRYEVRAFPTIVIADENGNQLHKSVGYQGAAPFAAMLQNPR